MAHTSAPEDRGEALEGVDDAPFPFPWWTWAVGVALSLLGLGVSGYLTYEHYTGSRSLTCPGGTSHGAIDCLKVTTSIYAVEHGIPVAVLGLVFFFVMLLLQSPWAWHLAWRPLRWSRIAWCLIGIATALKLVYDELFKIDAICLWCTSVHILTLLLFILTVFGTVSVAAAAAGY